MDIVTITVGELRKALAYHDDNLPVQVRIDGLTTPVPFVELVRERREPLEPSEDDEPALTLLAAWREAPALVKCTRCDGCGQLANSDDREPWSVWLDLPVRSAAAVYLGLVKPIPCDACGGTGKATPTPTPAADSEWAHRGQPCPGDDPSCPGQDGDPCHYRGPGAWSTPSPSAT